MQINSAPPSRIPSQGSTETTEVHHALVDAHDQLAKKCATDFNRPELDWDDRYQIARVTMMDCLRTWDPTRGVTFGAYAKPSINHALERAHKRALRFLSQTALSDTAVHATMNCCEEESGLEEDEEVAVREFVEQLPAPLRHYAHRHFWDGVRHKQIADELGVTPSAVTRMAKRVRALGLTEFSLN